MRISASIYSYKQSKSLEEIVSDLDLLYIDSFHIDSKDDLSVFDDIAKIRKISKTPIDLHIISSEPEKYYPYIEQYKIDSVQFQFEELHQHPILPPQNGTTKYGLSLMSETPIDVFELYKDFDFVLFMATTPGESGGEFNKSNFHRIRKFRQRYQNKQIRVDGGVNGEVAFILRNMGVSSVVCGSFLANNPSQGKALLDLRYNNVASHYLVSDFMLEESDVPILESKQTNLIEVLENIERYRLGFVMFRDEKGRFSGIASNADVRRGLLRHKDNIAATTVKDITNRYPFTVRDTDTIKQMLQKIRRQDFVVSFVPVINSKSQPVGAVTFFNLIRAEM
ncbi:MAG: CBS domain-containing protein [Paludibacteraceae bacterium]|nr:CBS domain-containing protein [Paludibacteraceae bacterium]